MGTHVFVCTYNLIQPSKFFKISYKEMSHHELDLSHVFQWKFMGFFLDWVIFVLFYSRHYKCK